MTEPVKARGYLAYVAYVFYLLKDTYVAYADVFYFSICKQE